jgi:hypothetical protein
MIAITSPPAVRHPDLRGCGSEGDGADGDLRLCLLQVRLGYRLYSYVAIAGATPLPEARTAEAGACDANRAAVRPPAGI